MPPEFRLKNQISPKNDVYSLGVIIIDILAGHTGYLEFREMVDVKPFIEQVRFNIKNNFIQRKVSHLTYV